MFWLSCEVLYSLDQKHMKQGCYIDNTTESLFQHGSVFACFSFSVVSLFVLVYVPRLLSSPAPSLHLCRYGGTVLLSLPLLYVAAGSQIWPRTERFSDTGNPLFPASLSTVLGNQQYLRGLFWSDSRTKHSGFIWIHLLRFMLLFRVVPPATYHYFTPYLTYVGWEVVLKICAELIRFSACEKKKKVREKPKICSELGQCRENIFAELLRWRFCFSLFPRRPFKLAPVKIWKDRPSIWSTAQLNIPA